MICYSQNCRKNCEVASKQSLISEGHLGEHIVESEKELKRKINRIGIIDFVSILRINQATIEKQIQKLQARLFEIFTTVMCKGVISDSKNGQQIINKVKDLKDEKFSNLNCSDISKILSTFITSINLVDMNARAHSFIIEMKNQIDSMQRNFVTVLNRLSPSEVLSVSSSSSSNITIQSISQNQTVRKNQSRGKFWDNNSEPESQINIVYYDQKSEENDSNIRKIEKQEEGRGRSNSMKMEEPNKKQNIFQKKQYIPEHSADQQLFENNISGIQKQKQEKTVNQSCQQLAQMFSQQNIGKSYIDNKQSMIYTQVIRLKDDPKYLSPDQKFNIRLKVIKQLMFRYHIETNSGKNFKFRKVKFLGGDETGVVVCYTNYYSFIEKGKYVELRDCSFMKFYDSYEITSFSCKSFKPEKEYQINNKICISDGFVNGKYVMQKFSEEWPSIQGLASQRNNKKIKLIAKISIFFESINKSYCQAQIYDGTGKVVVIINKDPKETLFNNCIYYFQNMKVCIQKLQQFSENILVVRSSLNLSLQLKNPPKLMKQFSYNLNYDDIPSVQPNINI